MNLMLELSDKNCKPDVIKMLQQSITNSLEFTNSLETNKKIMSPKKRGKREWD